MANILIVDDDLEIRKTLRELLTLHGFKTFDAENGKEGLEIFRKTKIDAILLDIRMPEMDGMETMQRVKKINPDVPIIFVTAYGDIPTAVEAVKSGAYDFIVKPVKIDRLLLTLRRALEKVELQNELKRLSTVMNFSLESVFGKSSAIKNIIEQIKQVAWTDFSVIIQGETGSGKTMVARIIHNQSKRADKPFVPVDIGAIPESLIESELFGYEKGAFTGAERRKCGFFEIADGGTILIDELENLTPYVQSKLLRVAEEKKIYPLGSTKPVDVNVRIIAATNTDIKKSVMEKKFREDLFYRLGEFIITIPPLRNRPEDIPYLAHKFASEAADELNKHIKEIRSDTVDLLLRYPWPGNVRELKNVIRRAVLLADNEIIKPEHIEFLIEEIEKKELPLLPLKEISAMAAKEAEKIVIKKALKMTDGNKTKAASLLQIDYKTLLTKIKEFGI